MRATIRAVLFFIEAVGFVEQLLNERLLAFLFFTQKCDRVRSLRGARHERSYLLLDLSKHDGRGRCRTRASREQARGNLVMTIELEQLIAIEREHGLVRFFVDVVEHMESIDHAFAVLRTLDLFNIARAVIFERTSYRCRSEFSGL